MSIPAWAVKGAKVVCVDAFEASGWINGSDPLVSGRVYTVERAIISPRTGEAMLLLAEAKRSKMFIEYAGFEAGYYASRFRPVKTIEDDISEHFAQHLTVRGSAPVEMAS
jgi:hypothetical protein